MSCSNEDIYQNSKRKENNILRFHSQKFCPLRTSYLTLEMINIQRVGLTVCHTRRLPFYISFRWGLIHFVMPFKIFHFLNLLGGIEPPLQFDPPSGLYDNIAPLTMLSNFYYEVKSMISNSRKNGSSSHTMVYI